jgi:hypothetical protein
MNIIYENLIYNFNPIIIVHVFFRLKNTKCRLIGYLMNNQNTLPTDKNKNLNDLKWNR